VQISKRLKINIEDLCLLQFIIDGYEGLGTITTIDKTQGIVEIFFCPAFLNDVEQIIKSLKKDFKLVEISAV
jgi:hypothetical protein